MSVRILLFPTVFLLALFCCDRSVLAQESAGATDNGAQMLIPPPVSGMDYSTALPAELHAQQNTLSFEMGVGSGYIHNLRAGTSQQAINDTTVKWHSSAMYSRSTTRSKQRFTYAPDFEIFQPTSTLNHLNQNAVADLRFRLSPHTMLMVSEQVTRTEAAFGVDSAQTAIAGSTDSITPGVVAPYAPQIANHTSAAYAWQTSRNAMLSVSGLLHTLHFTDTSQAVGFLNSSHRAGSASYTQRISGIQYAGMIGEYARIVATPPAGSKSLEPSDIRMASGYGFYTVYPQPGLTLSLMGGVQHYNLSAPGEGSTRAWIPAGMASLGWQSRHTSFAASGSHLVTSGYGTAGAYETSGGAAGSRWHLVRNWTLSLDGSYSTISRAGSVTLAGSLRGGHTASGTFSISHALSNQLDLTAGYAHMRQTYSGTTVLAANPESDQIQFSLTYHTARPLGR